MSSIYQQTKHKRIEGLVSATRAAMCFNCRNIAPRDELFKGWCQTCIGEWKATADSELLAQARAGYAPHACLAPPGLAQLDRLKSRVLHPKRDEDFLPLTQFMGARGVGANQAMWNVLLAMQTLELKTTAELHKLGIASHDTMHLCGRHAPVQRMSLQGLLSRIRSTEDTFTLLKNDKHLSDYVRGFVSDNRLLLWTLTRTNVDVFDRERTRRFHAKYGKAKFSRVCPAFWPFAPSDANEQHDLLEAIDRTVPKCLPESIRQDVCQDLVVSVLTGDITLDELQGSLPKHIKAVFKFHPTKYSHLSLDQPWSEDGATLGQMLDAAEYLSPMQTHGTWEPPIGPDGWHEGHDRAVGLGTIGEHLRHKHDGVAVEGLHIPEPYQMDEDVREVFQADINPRGYRPFVRRQG